MLIGSTAEICGSAVFGHLFTSGDLWCSIFRRAKGAPAHQPRAIALGIGSINESSPERALLHLCLGLRHKQECCPFQGKKVIPGAGSQGDRPGLLSGSPLGLRTENEPVCTSCAHEVKPLSLCSFGPSNVPSATGVALGCCPPTTSWHLPS